MVEEFRTDDPDNENPNVILGTLRDADVNLTELPKGVDSKNIADKTKPAV